MIEHKFEWQEYTLEEEFVLGIEDFEDQDTQITEDMLQFENSQISKVNISSVPFPVTKLDILLKNPNHLLELRLVGTQIEMPECQAIALNPKLSQLRSLDLSCNPIGIIGFFNLLKKDSVLENLKRLELFKCGIDHNDLKKVSKTLSNKQKLKFTKLQHLNLSHNNLGPFTSTLFSGGYGFLSESLECLILAKCQIQDDDIYDFVKTLYMIPNLFQLDLSHNLLINSYNKLMYHLIDQCQMISDISLSNCQFDQSNNDFTLVKDGKRRGFLFLKRLDLSNSISGNEQVQQIADTSFFKHLELLKLRNCKIGNGGLTTILESKNFSNLQVLLLSKNRIHKVECPKLSQKKGDPSLKEKKEMKLKLLDLRQNQILSLQKVNEISKLIKGAIILVWDNSIRGDQIKDTLEQQIIYDDYTKDLIKLKGFNPNIIFSPNQEQEEFFAQFL